MDDKWFKRQQKIAGVTAEEIASELGRDRSVVSRIYVGRQTMTTEQAKIFARVLDVPLAEVMTRAGILDQVEAKSITPGFADGDAIPFTHAPDTDQTQARARTFGGGRAGIDIWTVQTQAMMFNGYMPGDFILVDTHKSELCRAGDAVVAQVYDWQRGTATTLIRRFEPPVLVASGPDTKDQRVHVVDGNNVAIKGKIIASWRA